MVVKTVGDRDLDGGYRLKAWPEIVHKSTKSSMWIPIEQAAYIKNASQKPQWEAGMSFFSWILDKSFRKVHWTMDTKFPWDHQDKVVSITELDVYPFRYATTETKELFQRRGRMFWDCRSQKHIEYSGWDSSHREHFVSTLCSTRCTSAHLSPSQSHTTLRHYEEI